MKVLSVVFSCVLLVLGVVTARSYDVEIDRFQQRILEDTINQTINSAVEKIKPYDPQNIASVEQTIMGHNVSAQNISVQGFSNIYASHIKLSGLISWTIEITMNAPKITASVEHWAVTGDQFYGDGAATIEIDNLQLALTAKVSISSLTISNTQVTPSVGNVNVQVTGVFDDPEVSQKISDKASEYLTDTINNNQALRDKLAEVIENLVNSASGSS